MTRRFTDEEIQRHLDYEKERGRDNYSSYRMIQQLLAERDFHMQNECDADQVVVEMEFFLKERNLLEEFHKTYIGD